MVLLCVAGFRIAVTLACSAVDINPRLICCPRYVYCLETEGAPDYFPFCKCEFINVEGLASAERLLEWESGRLYPLVLSFLLAAAQNKNPDAGLKAQLSALLTVLGTSIMSILNTQHLGADL